MQEKYILTVVSQTIKAVQQTLPPSQSATGKVTFRLVELKAVGTWGTAGYPVSLHWTAYPGADLPSVGTQIAITVECAL
jgi:hypothetical protein